MMLFHFAGTNHHKYTTYLLEMIAILELESSPELKLLFLQNWLVNPSGEAGKWQAGDLLQEHLNLELQEFMSRKNLAWDSHFMRDIASPNAYHFSELKREWGSGVGLEKNRGGHTDPQMKPEVGILLQVYQDTELHLFRAGRRYGMESPARVTGGAPAGSRPMKTNEYHSMFWRGHDSLNQGTLERWVRESCRAQNMAGQQTTDELQNEIEQMLIDDEEPVRGLVTAGRCEVTEDGLIVGVGALPESELESTQLEEETLLLAEDPGDDGATDQDDDNI